ncbi:MAG: glycosyl hydrolase family 18 protein [Rhodothermales bacterium]
MRKAVFLLPVAALFISFCASPREAVPPPAERTETLVSGYHPWWMRDAWREYQTGLYGEIFFFSIDLDSTGVIAERNGWPDRWFSMQQELTGAGVRVTPVVTLFSQAGFEGLFAGSGSSEPLHESLISILRDSPAAGGLQLDFEIYQPVAPETRTNFTEFVERLRKSMAELRPNLSLSVYVTAYDESDVFDEAALARSADYLVVQGYDLHGRNEGRTGPVAGLEGHGTRNWKFIVDRLRASGVPMHKIAMSVPYFGYQWPAESDEPGSRTRGPGFTISYADVDSSLLPGSRTSAVEMVERYGLRRDAVSGSPYYAYQDSTGWHQGWFEDAESLDEKYRFIQERGLRGVAVFPTAYGDNDLEAVLRRNFGVMRRAVGR